MRLPAQDSLSLVAVDDDRRAAEPADSIVRIGTIDDNESGASETGEHEPGGRSSRRSTRQCACLWWSQQQPCSVVAASSLSWRGGGAQCLVRGLRLTRDDASYIRDTQWTK